MKKRQAKIERKTNETDITVEINVDGIGESSLSTGMPFFEHMLEQVAKHGGVDLKIDAKGDVYPCAQTWETGTEIFIFIVSHICVIML